MLAEGDTGLSTDSLAEHSVQDVVESFLFEEELGPVGLESLNAGLFSSFCGISVSSLVLISFFFLFLLIVASISSCSLLAISAVARSDLLLLDEDDTLRVSTDVASLHDGDNDLLLVDLLVKARVLEDLSPVEVVSILLGLAEAEHLLVHLLVGSEHADQFPN